ncbi:Na(+)-translocating NADH-quinone reductase subunit F [Formosa haliotis]|uniref:Na(+)-translocating NADH-quinone reductase subunit F n=1 Tax=Formosa haliotis TaxID=1555194 RepID=UPI0008251DC5|nr:Na(+)-translocating NADH-quinone reductase subunit F [Formosa haliotis]
MSKALSKQELHNLAMNHVGKELEQRGFEFVAINSKLKRHPQFVCIDANGQYFFVIVRAVLLPENPNNYDVVWMETFKDHARSKDAKVLYAGVGLGNPKGEELPVYLNEEYLIEYNGIQVIETHLN